MSLPFIFANQTQPNLSWLDANFAAVGALTTLPCVIAGTNTITLTQSANTPTIAAYTNYIRFSGIIAVTNTGAVTAQVGSLAALPVYKDTSSGPVALVSGDLRATNYAVFTYDSALNSGGGGFHAAVPSSGGGAGTVTSVSSGTGLTGGPITTSGTLSLASAANLTIKSNISGGLASPTDNTLTAVLDQVLGTAQGSVIFRNSSIWTVLGPGTNGQFLETQGAGANVAWASPTGSGTVNAATVGQLAYYASTGAAVSGTSTPNIGSATGTSLALSGAFTPNSTAGIVGTTTNDSATAGSVGEYISSNVVLGSATPLSTASATGIASIPLTAGDWDVRLQAGFLNASATVTLYSSSISLTNGTNDTTLGRFAQLPVSLSSNSNIVTLPIVPARFSLAAPATVYAVYTATFSAGSVGGFGIISARRVR